MGVIIYSFNRNISPQMPFGVFEWDIIMSQNYMLMISVIRHFVIKRGRSLCWALYIHINHTQREEKKETFLQGLLHSWHYVRCHLRTALWRAGVTSFSGEETQTLSDLLRVP